jgi:hypothetical protein
VGGAPGTGPSFRIPLRYGRRRRFALLVNAIGLCVTVAIVVWAVGSALEGTASGLVKAFGLLLTAALAAYLYVPALVRSLRGVCLSREDRLLLDDQGILVTHGVPPSVAMARLGWEDCAVLVSSVVPMPDGREAYYLQFVAAHAAAVDFPGGGPAIDAVARVLRVPEPLAAMTCFAPGRLRHELRDCVAWVRAHRPDVRIIASDDPSAEHLLHSDPGTGGAPLGEAVEGPEVAGGGEAGHEETGERGLEPR